MRTLPAKLIVTGNNGINKFTSTSRGIRNKLNVFVGARVPISLEGIKVVRNDGTELNRFECEVGNLVGFNDCSEFGTLDGDQVSCAVGLLDGESVGAVNGAVLG